MPKPSKDKGQHVKVRDRLNLDRRAHQIMSAPLADGQNADDLMTTGEVALWFGVSKQWLEIGRCKKHRYGPPFVQISPRNIRYRRDKVDGVA